jgi:hypothetical protein
MNDIHLDRDRLQALSRARGIANDAGYVATYKFCLQGINAGDVLDWSDAGLFLAVTGVTQQGLCAIAVSQSDPWTTVREIRMAAYALYLRLNQGWLCKVPRLRRQ